MTCEGDVDPLFIEVFLDFFLILGVVFEEMLESCNALDGKAVLGIFFEKAQIFLDVKSLQMGIGNVAFALVHKRAVKAAAPCEVLMIKNEYGQIAFFHKILRKI